MSDYKTYLALFVLSALASWLLVPLSIRLAHRCGAVDVPGGRKTHQQPTPRLGGLALFFGFFMPWLGLYFVENRISSTFKDFETFMAAMFLGAVAMLLLGMYDDIKGADAFKKFTVQIGTATVLWFLGIRIDELTNPWGPPIELGWWGLPISVCWLVGITNAINLLDGIDGLVAGVTLVMATALAIINILSHNVLIALLTVCLAGASLGFLPYNRTPARTFLGDSGSLTIGMVLACISVMSFFDEGRQSASSMITVPLILFALPLLDTARVMLGRFFRGKPIFQADRTHVHHRLLSMGLNPRQTTWTLYLVAAGTGTLAICLTRMDSGSQIILGLLLAAVGASAYALWVFRFRSRWTKRTGNSSNKS